MNAAVKAYQNVTQKAYRDNLVVEHLHCVRHVLSRIVSGLPDFVDTENLEAAGILGLVEASQQYDPARGIAFNTFAYHRIRGEILDELRRNSPLPQHVLQRWTLIRNAWDKLGEQANVSEVAQRLGLPESDVEECIAAMRFTRTETWQESMKSHQVETNDADQIEEKLEQQDQQRILADAIEKLPERLRVVLSLYYLQDLRLAEIAEVVKVSESRASRLLSEAELQLKQIVRSMETRAGQVGKDSKRRANHSIEKRTER